MTNPMAIILIGAGFIVLTAISYGLLFREIQCALLKSSFTQKKRSKIFNRSVGALVTWTVVISALPLPGIFLDFNPPPKLFFVLIISFVGVVWITFAKTTKEILSLVPPQT